MSPSRCSQSGHECHPVLVSIPNTGPCTRFECVQETGLRQPSSGWGGGASPEWLCMQGLAAGASGKSGRAAARFGGAILATCRQRHRRLVRPKMGLSTSACSVSFRAAGHAQRCAHRTGGNDGSRGGHLERTGELRGTRHPAAGPAPPLTEASAPPSARQTLRVHRPTTSRASPRSGACSEGPEGRRTPQRPRSTGVSPRRVRRRGVWP